MLIKPAFLSAVPAPPRAWSELSHGDWLRKQEQQVLQPFWTSIAGDYALQLGPLSEGISARCKATEKVTVFAGREARVQADLTALPFSRRSVDAVVLGHVLEYQQDPHQVLREADHVLAFDGYLVLTVFNPLSLASLLAAWPPWRKRAPWRGRYFSKGRIEDWLGLLNYEVLASGYVGNRALWPPAQERAQQQQNIIPTHIPLLRSCYYIVARKRVFPLTPSPGFLRFTPPVASVKPAQARSSRNI